MRPYNNKVGAVAVNSAAHQPARSLASCLPKVKARPVVNNVHATEKNRKLKSESPAALDHAQMLTNCNGGRRSMRRTCSITSVILGRCITADVYISSVHID